MKKCFSALFCIAILLVATAVFAEHSMDVKISAGDEWSWDPGVYNQFSGEIDLSEYAGKELTITVSSDLSYDEGQENDHSLVFTIVNGRRITMLKQKDNTAFKPESENGIMTFSGNIRLPDKKHVRSVTLYFTVLDEDGSELKRIPAIISMQNNGSGHESGIFYISLEIGKITMYIAAAAAAVWICALTANRIAKNKRDGR